MPDDLVTGAARAALSRLASSSFVALTGAGVSTDSGIPDYRGAGHRVRMPMTYQEFVSGPESRQRYWARAHVGWSRMRDAVPNAGHQALARLGHGPLRMLLTQNVDGLHERAGQPNLVALHGRVGEVVCLDCHSLTPGPVVQAQMARLNPGYAGRQAGLVARPDGDVELEDTSRFVVPGCAQCGGRLKPHVVFFGENVPMDRVERAQAALEESEALLVAGSTLTVMSGFRFVRQAARQGIPVVIVNRGPTRGDDLATCKIDAGCSELLGELAREAAALRPA
ncbi:MAG: NAD-dependent protein deacetylase [Actinomycetota bacterium]|nr:NAD-dependent protein deacetylase [Actinomycetota bacterium]